MGVSKNGGTQQLLVFLLKRIILGCEMGVPPFKETPIYNIIYIIYIYVYIPGPSSLGAKWFRFRVSIHHSLRFNWHPLEGAGICIYIYIDLYIYIPLGSKDH